MPKSRTMMYTQQIAHFPLKEVRKLEERIRLKIKPLKYAIITHDKDVDENGNAAEEHIHVVLTFKNARSVKNIARLLSDKPQYLEVWDGREENAFAYLVHQTEKSKTKYQYAPTEVIANFDYADYVGKMAKKVKTSQANTVNVLLDALVAGQITPEEAENRLSGSQLSRNAKLLDTAYAKWLQRHAKEWRKQKIKENALVAVIWIFGKAGTGKTSLAKAYAEKKSQPYFISGSNRDIFQQYHGEHTVILDEFRATVDIAYSDLLKMFDPYSIANEVMAPARYNDRALACDLFIVTSPYSPAEYYDELVYRRVVRKDIDRFDQLLRRISIVVEMTDTEIRRVEFDATAMKFIPAPASAKPNPYSSASRPAPSADADELFEKMFS